MPEATHLVRLVAGHAGWLLKVQDEIAGAPEVEAVVRRYAWVLLAAAMVGLVARRLNLPYAVALVVAGLLVEESHVVTVPDLDPNLLLFVFLPPLLFDAAFRLDVGELSALIRPVLILAVPGALLTAFVVGAIVALLLNVPIGAALLFGSIVAATDPVAVIGVFRYLRVPGRLATLAKAESLINDGMAITLYIVLRDFAVSGTAQPGAGVLLFAQEVFGGVLIGAALGVAASHLTRRIDDHLIEMTLSTALAYGSFLLAQQVEASGALACVAAGLIHGSYGRTVGMSAKTGRHLDDLWEYLGFVANALVFLLLGFSVHVGDMREQAWPVAVAIAAVLMSRVVVITLTAHVASPGYEGMRSRPERAVLIWGGLRGALTAALALALPASTPSRDLLVAMAFGVTLFTLVVQGLTLPALIRRVGLAREA